MAGGRKDQDKVQVTKVPRVSFTISGRPLRSTEMESVLKAFLDRVGKSQAAAHVVLGKDLDRPILNVSFLLTANAKYDQICELQKAADELYLSFAPDVIVITRLYGEERDFRSFWNNYLHTQKIEEEWVRY